MTSKPKPKVKPVNCLRCRQCRLLDHSNIAQGIDRDVRVPIRCEKIGRNRPAFIHGECPFADGRNQSAGGDFSCSITPVEKEFLTAHYPTASKDLLMKLTLRNWNTLGTVARLHCKSHRTMSLEDLREGARHLVPSRQAKGQVFTPEQLEYIQQRYASGNWTTTSPKHRDRPAQALIRQDIVDEVAKRGAPKSFRAITRALSNRSPSKTKKRKKENHVNHSPNGPA